MYIPGPGLISRVDVNLYKAKNAVKKLRNSFEQSLPITMHRGLELDGGPSIIRFTPEIRVKEIPGTPLHHDMALITVIR